MSYDKICVCNVSVVRINGKMSRVGSPTLRSYDTTRFGAGASAVEPCKGCVLVCFGARCFASIRVKVQFSDMSCRTIGFAPIIYPLYGLTVQCAR